jgi:hypothetical protein
VRTSVAIGLVRRQPLAIGLIGGMIARIDAEPAMRDPLSAEDLEFKNRIESGELPPAEFDHRAHLRLAWVYLADGDEEAAHAQMRATLLRFLEHHGINASKFHETITRAWILAVRHFAARTPDCATAAEFLERNPVLLDSRVMLTHYTKDVLFSPEARRAFVEPDRDPIPRHP